MANQAFIRMNTREIRRILEARGYVNRNRGLDCEFSGDTICTIHEEWMSGNIQMQYMSFWIDRDFEEVVVPCIGYVDCGIDVEKLISSL